MDLGYLTDNVSFSKDFAAAKVPGVALVEPEGTTRRWLDFRAVGLEVEELAELLSHRARVMRSI